MKKEGKNFYIVFQKMMRLLLILISLLSLKANSTEYYEYIVQPGDTLSEIAEANNQSLVDIYNINKKLNFNPNKIEVGQSIILQKFLLVYMFKYSLAYVA